MSNLLKVAKGMNLSCLCRVGNVSMSPIFRAVSANVRPMSSGRSNCATDEGPRCSEANLKNKGCDDKKKDSTKKSMWENPECCMNPCPDVLPRFDELYYKASDKAKRKYMQTWVECPKIQIVPKKVCCFEPSTLPPLERRVKNDCPKTACTPDDSCKTKAGGGKCRKIISPGCKGARDPPKCKTERGPSNCKKVCAPYPSFSECTRDPPKQRHPIECPCLRIPAMCEIWAALRASSGQGDSAKP